MKIYDYSDYATFKRIVLIALDDAQDTPKLILKALGNMGVDGLIVSPGYTYGTATEVEKLPVASVASPRIKQQFKKYVIRALDEL